MNDPEWGKLELEDDGEEMDIGALLREAFDPEKGEYPPLFFETVLLAEGLEERISRHERRALEERLLRRFFASLGKDYDAWRRERRRQRLKRYGRAIVVLVGLVALALGAGAPFPWLPVRWPWPAAPQATPMPGHYRSVAEIQAHFSLPLPAEAPAGYALADAALDWGPAGPRAALTYRRAGEEGDSVTLLVRPAEDEPLAAGGAPGERVELAGRPGWWVAEGAGGWVLWEEEGWRLGLRSATLPRSELVAMAEGFIGR